MKHPLQQAQYSIMRPGFQGKSALLFRVCDIVPSRRQLKPLVAACSIRLAQTDLKNANCTHVA